MKFGISLKFEKKGIEKDMSSNIYGSISYNDKSYPFFLEDRKVIIVGSAWEYYDDLQNIDNEIESIPGVTSDNKQILFLKCKFGFSSLRQKVWFSSIGYILSNGNVGDPYNFTFEKASFYSDALNAFYPPQQALKTDLDLSNWDGKMTVGLKPFEETELTFNYEECKCKLNIARYVTLQVGKSDIGNINSAFSFEFNTAQPCKELPKYWLALFDFLSFINYGTDIAFDKIILSNKREDGLFAHCADAYIFSDKEYLPRSLINTITVRDIPSDKLGVMFSRIVNLRGHDKRLGYYFPETFKEGFRIDANRWLVKAMTFEGLFRDCYPEFKQNEKESFRLAKETALDALNSVDQSQMAKRERSYFDDCKKQIEHYEGRLEEMLNFIVRKYKDEFDDLLRFNQKEYHMNSNDYGNTYSNYRNKIAHGDIAPVGENEVAVYRVLQAAIYFMLLDGADLGSDTLRVIAKKLFL